MRMPVSYGHISRQYQYYDINIMILNENSERSNKHENAKSIIKTAKGI